MNQQQSIIALDERGWSRRRIARELGLDRGTVRKYLAGKSKPATNPQTGSNFLPGPVSLCDPWREQIEEALERGLTIQRIYQECLAGSRLFLFLDVDANGTLTRGGGFELKGRGRISRLTLHWRSLFRKKVVGDKSKWTGGLKVCTGRSGGRS